MKAMYKILISILICAMAVGVAAAETANEDLPSMDAVKNYATDYKGTDFINAITTAAAGEHSDWKWDTFTGGDERLIGLYTNSNGPRGFNAVYYNSTGKITDPSCDVNYNLEYSYKGDGKLPDWITEKTTPVEKSCKKCNKNNEKVTDNNDNIKTSDDEKVTDNNDDIKATDDVKVTDNEDNEDNEKASDDEKVTDNEDNKKASDDENGSDKVVIKNVSSDEMKTIKALLEYLNLDETDD